MTGAHFLIGFLRLNSWIVGPLVIMVMIATTPTAWGQDSDLEDEIELVDDEDEDIEEEELDDDMEEATADTTLKKRQIKKWIRWADEAYFNKNYRKAVIYYESLASHIKEDNSYFKFKAGICYLLSSLDSKRAIELIEAGKDDLGDTELRSEYYYYLGRAYHFDEQYRKAKVNYEIAALADSTNRELEVEVDRQIEMCQYGEQFVKEPGNVMISNAGHPLNSEYADYKPVPNFDESQIIFTSRREIGKGDDKDETGRYYEDVFVSQRDGFGNWGVPAPLSDEINSAKHESSSFLSEDGHKLIIYKSTRKDGAGLYLTEFDGTSWSKPKSFGENINSKFWETSAALSPDGNTLYFVSNRRGGMGGRDMYYSKKQETGEWGPAINLVDINTEFDEESPFISADGKTLFFSSQGHSSIGGFDIFKTTFENGEWSEPENLGHPVNTPADDAHFSITNDGTRAYVTSARVGGKGESDVYTLTFLDNFRLDIPVRTFVRNNMGEPVQANIRVVDGASLRPAKTLNLNTGSDYISYLQGGRSYELLVEADGYTPEMISFTVPEQTNYHEVYQYIEMDQKEMFGKKVAQTIKVSHLFTDVKQTLKGDKSIREHTHPINREYLLLSSNKILNNWGDLSPVQSMVDASDKITGLVAAHYETVLNEELYSDLNTYTHFYSGGQQALLAKVVGDDTVYVMPPTKPTTAVEVAMLDERLKRVEQSLLMDSSNAVSENIDLALMVEQAVERDIIEPLIVAETNSGELATNTVIPGDSQSNVAQTGTAVNGDSNIETTAVAIMDSAGTTNTGTGTTAGGNSKVETTVSPTTDATGNAGSGTSTTADASNPPIDKAIADNSSSPATAAAKKLIYDKAVYFGYDKTGISDDYKKELDKIAQLAKNNPGAIIEVEGHTDSRGSESYNITLSKRRAKIVSDYLASVGIPRNRMVIKGYGENRPIAPNANPDGSDNPAGREKNRRTEIRLKG